MIYVMFLTVLNIKYSFLKEENFTKIIVDNAFYTGKKGMPILPVIPIRCQTLSIIDSFDVKTNPITPSYGAYPLIKNAPVGNIEMNPAFYHNYPSEPIKYAGKNEFIFYPVKVISTDSIRIYTKINIYPLNTPLSKDTTVYDYIIITPDAFKAAFEKLASWRQRQGMKTKIIIYENAILNQQGRDNAEKLRNYIKNIYEQWHFKYLLLGGDVDFIPVRKAYAMTSRAHYHQREDSIPADLYYSDLSGSWDENNNNVFGEIDDNVDLYPDIVVGRAPVNSIQQSEKFVQKIIAYESAKDKTYFENLLFSAMVLWNNPFTDGGIAKDMIDDHCVPNDYEVTKLYQSKGNGNRENFINEIKKGKGFINNNAHGWINEFGLGEIYFKNEDADILTNEDYGIMYSIGCWTGAFDFDCIAEHMVLSNGGVVAYIGNSSYGWGSPGNPGFGYSDVIDEHFYDILYNDTLMRLGDIFALTKEYFVPLSRDTNVFRWHQYELNLIGDPALKVYTAKPFDINIYAPDSVMLNDSFKIFTRHDSTPIKSMISIIQHDSLLFRCYTDKNGYIKLMIEELEPDTFFIYAHSRKSRIDSFPCYALTNGAYYKAIHISYKKKDGSKCLPNDTVMLSFYIKNTGTDTIRANKITIESSSLNISLLKNTLKIDNLPAPGDSMYVEGFSILLKNKKPENALINIGIWGFYNLIEKRYKTSTLLHPDAGWVKLTDYSLKAAPLPGKATTLLLTLYNPGFGEAKNIQIIPEAVENLSCEALESSSIAMHDTVIVKLNINVSPDADTGHYFYLPLNIHSEYYSYMDTVKFVAANTGFSEDFENGLSRWNISIVEGDISWDITDSLCHSSKHALSFASKENDGNHIHGIIESQYFYLPKSLSISMWIRYQFVTYGTEGTYIILLNDKKADTIGFIGAGGALNLPIFSDWGKMTFHTYKFMPGDRVKLKISFVSKDGMFKGHGIYIDDINTTSYTGVEEEKKPPLKNIELLTPSIGKSFILELNIQNPTTIKMEIFNATGAKIKSKKLTNITKGIYRLWWNGEDDNGTQVENGVYFIKISFGNNKYSKKIILLK